MDPFDIVRAYYRALNRRDVEAVVGLYDPACITEDVFLNAGAANGGLPDEIHSGRDANRARLVEFLEQYEGGFDDGSCFRVRTIGGIQTGWGWIQADWIERVRSRPDGTIRQLRGSSQFLIEDGLIRRHRSVAKAGDVDTEPVPDVPQDRHYPKRPVVGVGAVILVSPDNAPRIGWRDAVPDPGVVLIKRRFEPLAGQWSLPGGMLEIGETLEAGVAREMAEETGLTVDVGPVIEVFDRILLDQDTRVQYHFVLIDYLCRPLAGRLSAGSDVVDVTIADPDQLAGYHMTAKAEAVIRRAIQVNAD
jgi:8-oxo-dGTP diphosphatase